MSEVGAMPDLRSPDMISPDRPILGGCWGREYMGWPAPSDSKTAIRKAGDRIRKNVANEEDLNVLNRWRAAHGYIINTFQATLRTRTKNMPIPVAQRLKRAATIVDKLQQGRALDLYSMHDIAGVRLVFPDVETLVEFRALSHRSRAKHELVNATGKYDYLANPKSSGYRGIHDVYKYSAGTDSGAKWNDLLIEVQYRTLVQHAWATAVELADVLTANRTKFNQGTPENSRFFQICSELLARKHESATSCLPDLSHADLVSEWRSIESRARIFQQLRSISQQQSAGNLKGFVLLIVQSDGNLVVEPQKSYREAIANLLAAENEHPEWDIVLASGDRDESLRSAFRNYFRNSTEFISLIEAAL
jgi:ppGpp synthetase/RelA/SpoT-type nucleotidyltranferase